MMGGSAEATLELWASSLRTVKERIRPLCRQDRTAASAGLFLDTLLGPERRKTGWMRAEAAGDPGPWRQQALLDRSRWDAAALRDLVRTYARARVGLTGGDIRWQPSLALVWRPCGSDLSALDRGCA